MGYLSFNYSYYEQTVKLLEDRKPLGNGTMEAKRLLCLLNDLEDEGYTELTELIERGFKGKTRLQKFIENAGDKAFERISTAQTQGEGKRRDMSLNNCLDELCRSASTVNGLSNKPVLRDLAGFCDFLGKRSDAGYVFLLRDTLLPCLALAAEGVRVYPWLIGRSFVNYLAPNAHIDDLVRAVLYEALEAGYSEQASFITYCKGEIRRRIEPYPQLVEALRGLLGSVSEEKLIVVESGVSGTFPLLLSALDERVDFRLFTTAPYLLQVFGEKVYSNEYEKNRCVETLCAHDELFEFSNFEGGEFFVSVSCDSAVRVEAQRELAALLKLRR